MITAATRLAAVIGSPVRHSLSPAIHNAAFAAGGHDWAYVALEVAPGRGADAVRAVTTLGLGGLSVTMPHKADAAAAVDRLVPAAAALRSVNTVAVAADGTLEGHSTDGDGFVASLAAVGIDLAGADVVVVGAGGAGRAVVHATAAAGAARVTVVNRSPERAREAAALAGPVGVVGTHDAIAGADLVVNATSIGMGSTAPGPGGTGWIGTFPFDPDLVGPAQVVVDLVYHPLETPLLAAAAARGAVTVDGLGMLVHQAALQQQLWLGVLPDVAAMRAAAERELALRAP